MSQRISQTPTPYPVNCPVHGLIYLTVEEGERQSKLTNTQWLCPIDRDPLFFADPAPDMIGDKFIGNFGQNPKKRTA